MKKLTHVNTKGKAEMVDVGDKEIQHRNAKAKGCIFLAKNTVKQITENSVKKGDVLTVAQLAGINAAKQTSGLIPLCHNIMLENIKVSLAIDNKGVIAESEVRCTGKTGAEMEALTAVTVALLTVYDMCKAIDSNMSIGDITLIEKNKNMKLPESLDILIITLSDRAFNGEYKDKSGPGINDILTEYLNSTGWKYSIKTVIIPDNSEMLREHLIKAGDKFNFIFTSGGTGIGPRDITYETVMPLLTKEIPGIMEYIRVKYGKDNPNALLSRSIAGVIGKAIIYTLPGSVKAVEEYMSEILKTMLHSVNMQYGIDIHEKH